MGGGSRPGSSALDQDAGSQRADQAGSRNSDGPSPLTRASFGASGPADPAILAFRHG